MFDTALTPSTVMASIVSESTRAINNLFQPRVHMDASVSCYSPKFSFPTTLELTSTLCR